MIAEWLRLPLGFKRVLYANKHRIVNGSVPISFPVYIPCIKKSTVFSFSSHWDWRKSGSSINSSEQSLLSPCFLALFVVNFELAFNWGFLLAVSDLVSVQKNSVCLLIPLSYLLSKCLSIEHVVIGPMLRMMKQTKRPQNQRFPKTSWDHDLAFGMSWTLRSAF